MACLNAKVKSIIKERVKTQSIKKEVITFDSSLLECDLSSSEFKSQSSSQLLIQPTFINLTSLLI